MELTQFIIEGCQIANSLTEQCGHKNFPNFWVLGGLQANRTLPVVRRSGA
jgi:hypothetical protein